MIAVCLMARCAEDCQSHLVCFFKLKDCFCGGLRLCWRMDRCVGQWTSSCCDCVVKVCCMWNPAAVFEVWELILIRKYVCFWRSLV